MKFESIAAAALVGLAAATTPGHSHSRRAGIYKRQVPQEHSHETYLTIVREFLALDNPKQIQDPVFGLLGDAAATVGAGQVTNLACLKQETADQAFTNAKAAGDIRGMSAALVFQALERNTGGVGVLSAACTDSPVNPEIAAFPQHQDAAADGAQAINKGIALELAKQLALIGGDPLLALESGTFNPGDKADTTGAGNTCDDANDTVGCIFTQRLLFLDATPDEITAAVAGITPTFTGTGELKATNIDFAGLNVAQVDTPVTPTALPATGGAATGGNAGADAGNANAGTGNADTCNAGNGTAVAAPVAAEPAADAAATASAAPAADTGADAGAGAAVGALDLGKCSDPTIKFAAGLDGRKEEAFIANNQADFNHGSAQKIGIIATFICQRLNDTCAAPQASVDQCDAAATAAQAATQDQTAADTFNSMMGGAAAASASAGNAGNNNGGADAAAGDNNGGNNNNNNNGAADACPAKRRRSLRARRMNRLARRRLSKSHASRL